MADAPDGGRRRRRQRQRVVALETVPASRMRWVFALLCLCLIGLMGRMAWLQVFQASVLEARARRVQTQHTDPLGTRRPIVDRAGRLVALDEERFRLWAHPNNFRFPGDPPSVVREPLDWPRQPRRLVASHSMSLEEAMELMAPGRTPEIIAADTPEAWNALMDRLGRDEVTELLVEGGGELAAQVMLDAAVRRLMTRWRARRGSPRISLT